jgi:hypothetical protein
MSTVSVSEGADTSLAAVLGQAGAPPPAAPPYEDDSLDPHARKRGGDLTWLGWTLVGVGGASLAGAIVSMVIVSDVNSDPLYEDYRDAVARGNDKVRMANMPMEVVDDVCAAAEKGSRYDLSAESVMKVNDLCNKGATFEVLQWVFLGTAVAAGGAGAYLLLTQDGEPSEGAGAAARMTFQPRFAPGRASLSATLRF